MSVTNYDNITCKYTIEKLDKMVYFVPESAIGSIIVDGTVDYVHSAGTHQAIECYALSLSEGDTLDERFEFTHSLNFSVDGYMNKDDIEYRYVIVKDLEGTYWLLNPRFPCKLTYTYTLDATSNHTDFVVSTKSNFPMLRVQNFNPEDTRTCSGYNYCGFDYLELNDTRYSKIDDEAVYYTNNGFKLVKYLKNTATLTETYDGNNVSHEVKFNINFDDYKSSWHYTLLEFQDNKYAAVISTKCGKNIACGFGYGLQPSFTVTASDTQFNSIEIKLSDLHDQGHLIWMPQDVPYSHTTGTTWVYVQDEYECVNSKQAKHLLMQEHDFFGNPLNNYMCLEGYEWQYQEYNIVGTYPYSSDILFNCKYCKPLECGMETSIPKKITFTESGECKAYSIKCDSFFTLSATSNNITVYPISGEANTYYSVRICNFAEPTTSGTLNYEVILNYCNDNDKRFNVEVVAPSPTNCLPQGLNYNISSDAQYVRIPTSCCIASADCINSVNAHSFQIQDGYVLFRANNNQTGSERQFIIKLIKCDSTTATVYVTQASYYSRWVVEERVCNANQMCDFERMYSGATPQNVNTPTYMTRWNNCSASTECATQNTRWVETSYTGCNGTHLHVMEQYQISYDNGQTWTNTGQMRYGREIPDTSLACVQREYRWTSADTTTCVGYNLYQNYKKEESVAGGPWTVVSPLTLSYDGDGTMPLVLVESASTICGYVPPVEPQYRWEALDPNVDWYCDGVDKWTKEIRQISTDGGITWSNVTPLTTRAALPVIEYNSSDCGYIPPTSPIYQWVAVVGGYECSGTTKMTQEKEQVSYDNGSTWEDVVPLTTRAALPVIEYDSEDCGYVPPITSDYLTFIAEEDGTFTFTPRNSNVISYSLDSSNTWVQANSVNVNAGDVVMWKGEMTPESYAGIGKFGSSGHFHAEGNVMSLLYGDDFSGQTSLSGYDYVFCALFLDCSRLTNIENLSLPATTLADNCYTNMFYGCSGLTTAPELPATTLASSCYSSMFRDCTSLTTAPELPAKTLANYCYYYMFNGCTNLNYIKCMATNISALSCTSVWLLHVAASGTFVTPSSTPWTSGGSGIPSGWTRVNA